LVVSNFIVWWNKQLTKWVIIFAIITIAQIPHMVWNADLYLEMGIISKVNPIFDFILYGIDLIEIPAIVIAVMTLIARLTKNKALSKR
jgi:hypothetical protein